MNTLPEYYVIQRVDGDPRWQSYIDHLNTTYDKDWDGRADDYYYGYNGGDQGCRLSVAEFINNPTLLTLDEFEAMTTEFVVLENWCIRGCDAFANWCAENKTNVLGRANTWYYHRNINGNNMQWDYHGSARAYTEITFDQFIKYIAEPVLPAFDKNNWMVLANTEAQRLEVATWIDAQDTDPIKAIGHQMILHEDFCYIQWHGKLWSISSKINNETIITWEQFQSLKTTSVMVPTTQIISRYNLREIYNNVCDTWQTVIREKLNANLFDPVFSFSNDVIEKGYKEADDQQKILIKKYFTIAEKDKNPFKRDLNHVITDNILADLFNGVKVMQLYRGNTDNLNNRAFFLQPEYKIVTKDLLGCTIISIERR